MFRTPRLRTRNLLRLPEVVTIVLRNLVLLSTPCVPPERQVRLLELRWTLQSPGPTFVLCTLAKIWTVPGILDPNALQALISSAYVLGHNSVHLPNVAHLLPKATT